MTAELMYGVLVAGGLAILLIAWLLFLGKQTEKAGKQPLQNSEPSDAQPADGHRLSVAIAEALMEHQFIEPSRFNEVAQIVALKIELQQALGAPDLRTGGKPEVCPARRAWVSRGAQVTQSV